MSIYESFSGSPYVNPLVNFRSYTYNFAWLICSKSSAMQQVINNTSLSSYNRSPNDKFKVLPEGYIVLFNSTTDAEYYIKTVKYTNNIIMGSSSVKESMGINSVGHTLQIQVVEPYTVDFMQHILDAAGDLGVAVSGLQHLLKIWFTGYTVDSTVNGGIQHITDIKPISFIINDISMTLTQGGAVYDIKCDPVPGAGGNPATANVGGFSYATGRTLQSAINDLNIALAKLSNSNPLSDPATKYLTYKVVLDPAYLSNKYTLTNLDVDAMNSFNGDLQAATNTVEKSNAVDTEKVKADGKNYHIVTEKSDTINTIIEKIFAICPEVIKDAAGVLEGDHITSYIHDTHNEFYNSDVNHAGFVFYIKRKPNVIKQLSPEEVATSKQSVPPANADKIAPSMQKAIANNSYMELDYIYTGNNTEIIQFVMHIPNLSIAAMGASKHIQPFAPGKQPAQLVTTNSAPDQMNNTNSSDTPVDISSVKTGAALPVFGNGTNNKNLEGKDVASPLVLMPPPVISKTNDAGAHSIDPSSYMQYRKNMIRYISKITTTADLEIRGNPYLLDSFVVAAGMLTNKSGEPDTAANIHAKINAPADTNHALSGWMSYQPYIKINIRVPKKVDAQGKILEAGFDNKFSTPFWADGIYMPTLIEHSFSDGNFTQRLHLTVFDTNLSQANQTTLVNGIPVANGTTTDISETGANSKSKRKETEVAAPTGTSAGSNMAVSHGPNPSPEQSAMVDKVSAKFGVDPALIRAIITQESGWKSKAVGADQATGTVKSCGLMQIDGVVQRLEGCVNPYDQQDNVISGTAYMCQFLIKFNGNLDYAIAAYNWGIGHTTKWIKAGAHFNALPAVTRKYIRNVTNAVGSHTTQVPLKISAATVRRSFENTA